MALRGARIWAGLLLALPCAGQTEAERLIEAGHWKRARALVEAQARQSTDALTEFLLSQIHNAFGDYETPLPLADKAVAMDARVAKYHRQIAEVTGVMAQHANVFQQLLLARRFKREIEIALTLNPRDVQALRDLMEFYLLAPGIAGGDRERARATAARISAVDPVEGYLAEARMAEAAGDRARQEAILRKAVEAGPASYRARVALAGFLLTHGDFEGARREAETAIQIDASRVDAYSVLTPAYAHENRIDELEATLAVAEKQVPDDLSPFYRAGEVFWKTGENLDRAERYFRRYLESEPEGNAPTRADAQAKLQQVLEKRTVSAKRVTREPN